MKNPEERMALLSMLPGGIYCCEVDGTDCHFNAAICNIFGCIDGEMLHALAYGNIRGLIHPADADAVLAEFCKRIKSEAAVMLVHRILRRDGRVRWVRHVMRLDESEGQKCLYGIMLDETESTEKSEALQRSEERLRILADLDNDIIFDMDCKSGKVEVYGDFIKRFGRKPTADDFQLHACGTSCMHMEHHIARYPSGTKVHIEKMQHDIQLPTGDGRLLWCRHQSEIIRDEKGVALRHTGRLLNAEDIKAQEEVLRRRAQHDLLTGVLNREAAQEQIMHILNEGTRFPHVMMVLDLDNFKHINDTYGHPAGDWVLCRLGEILTRAFRLGDIVGRLGGDEFMVFLSNAKSREKILQRVSRLCKDGFVDIDRSIIGGEAISFSLGAAYSMKPGATFAAFYETADRALYESKRKDKGLAHFWDL